MNELIVTSMSRAGYEATGRHAIASIVRYWPAVPFVVYGDEPLDVAPAAFRLTSDITPWKKQTWVWRRRPPQRPPHGWIKARSYIWDVQRFAVKPFVWLDAAEWLGDGILTWLDADTELVAPMPDGFMAHLLGGRAVAYLGRSPMHPETGWITFRIPEALPLLRWMVRAYQRQRYLHWTDGWTDCHTLRHGFWANRRVSRRDLTSRLRRRWHSRVDAMALSPLGPYVVHYKGRRLPVEQVA